ALLRRLRRRRAGRRLKVRRRSRDTRDSYIRSDAGLVATVGVKDLVLVVTEDAVLAADRGRSQDIKQVVDRLEKNRRVECQQHRTTHRPWGWFQLLHLGDRYQVKRLYIRPGAKIQLQKHAQRAEHWVVVDGHARVTLDNDIRMIGKDESILIPVGSTHSVENSTDAPLVIVEVQSGGYLGEDDVTRFETLYGTEPIGD
ncbi:MAG: cupin domain-containing protein, partial [Pseudomonadota bacterium]